MSTDRVFIIGGGPSFKEVLSDPDLKAKLEREKVIGCNVAPKYIRCDVLIYFDNDFEQLNREMINKFCGEGGLVYAPRTARHNDSNEKIIFMMHTITPTVSIKDGLYFHGNTGNGALSLALKLGIPEICLVGFDLKYKNGATNYHNEYKKSPGKREPEKEFEHMIWGFNKLAEFIKSELPHIKVWNCSEDSRLSRKDYPYKPIREALS